MEKSLVLIKPIATSRGLATVILSRLEVAGYKMRGLKMLHMDEAMAEQHYSAHKGKDFFEGLIKHITSGPIVAAVFEGEDAISQIRLLMGATDPAKAAMGTIRREFGIDIRRNATHASDSMENADKEINLFFKGSELFDYEFTEI